MESKEEKMRAAKLALARKKLKDHQEKKLVTSQKTESAESEECMQQGENNNVLTELFITSDNNHCEVNKSNPSNVSPKIEDKNMDINITEILISNKINLEAQLTDLEYKYSELKSAHCLEMNNHNVTKQQVNNLQAELKHLNDKYVSANENILQLDKQIKDLTTIKTSICDENNNLTEQLELTKTMLTAKEKEITTLRSHTVQLQNELDVTKLQLQQLNNGLGTCLTNNGVNSNSEEKEILAQKINSLEQQLKISQKEKDQINMHYESYVAELNEQLKSLMVKYDELSKKYQNLSIRESNLIKQIGDMEIRLQHFQSREENTVENNPSQTIDVSVQAKEILEKYSKTQEELQAASKNNMELQQLYAKSESKVIELQEVIDSYSTHENISVSKLTADIASDKVAAQRATEQNKKLKSSMQELEEAFIKMSQDKLELTEKLTAEKYLNRELTIKLAEIEEKSKDMHTKLMAKDEEMIRLQVTYRDLKKEFDEIINAKKKLSENITLEAVSNEQNVEKSLIIHSCDVAACLHDDKDTIKDSLPFHDNKNLSIPREDAMIKLQERFLKIMGDVADLSDEKHRLEHIILQLQNETDTICEYVALYQHQRSLLKKRDEERSAQIKLFQVECDRLKNQLEELSGILLRFAEDKELSSYFKVESRQNDMDKVRSLLLNLKSNTLVDPKNSLELSNIYPCNCCSGNLIDV